ncbi:class I SAM-dependent methyltransferase [Plantactinospora endophytica]|nr:class I SAM-dependent methyltransferase [Plantactinospora endophytica]
MPRTVLEQTALDGDFAKRHLINPVLLRMLGDLTERRVLDAGCGNGYLSRILAGRGATVVGVEPGQSLFDFAVEQETTAPQGIRYIQADLCDLPNLGGPFDAVVASMVLPAIPDWIGAMRACVHALKPGGLFLFTVNHPCYEQLWPTWREHGEYRTHRYLTEYEIPGPNGVDFHRTLSTYLNQVTRLGCHLTELAEPGLDPDATAHGPDGIDAYVHLPNFLIIAARRTT